MRNFLAWAAELQNQVIIGIVATTFVWLLSRIWPHTMSYVPGTDEYEDRVINQKAKDEAARQNNDVFYTASPNGISIKLFSGNIANSSADAIVSSDDTLLSATGGVAKAIASASGRRVRRRMRELSRNNLGRGAIAITDGGNTSFRYLLHAAVLTKAPDHTDYPSRHEVEGMVRRLVDVADGLAVGSLALPVIAGGTASKRLRAEGLVSNADLIVFLLGALVSASKQSRTFLHTVYLVVYDNTDLTDELARKLNAEFGSP